MKKKKPNLDIIREVKKVFTRSIQEIRGHIHPQEKGTFKEKSRGGS